MATWYAGSSAWPGPFLKRGEPEGIPDTAIDVCFDPRDRLFTAFGGERRIERHEPRSTPSADPVWSPTWQSPVVESDSRHRNGHQNSRPTDVLTSLDVSGDGRWLAVATHWGHIELFDSSGKQVDACTLEWDLTAIAFNPASTRLAALSRGGRLFVFSLSPSGLSPETEIPFRGGHELGGLAWTPDGRQIIVGDRPAREPIWVDLASQKEVELRNFARWTSAANVHDLVLGPDGVSVLLACGDGTLRLFRGPSDPGEIILSEDVALFSAAWRPSGELVVCGRSDGELVLLETESWQVVGRTRAAARFEGATRIMSLAFSPSGRWLAVGTEGPFHPILDLLLAEGLLAHQYRCVRPKLVAAGMDAARLGAADRWADETLAALGDSCELPPALPHPR